MNYIGSKKTIIDFISESIHKVAGTQPLEFCDLFAGTGAVGAYFKKQGYRIISNDLQHYAYVINRHLIQNHLEMSFDGLVSTIPILLSSNIERRKNIVCEYLTNIDSVEGFIYKNYSPASINYSEYERMYFTEENAKKCDGIRQKIEEWHQIDAITENEYYFLISSLINSADKHANVLSVYGAFLKKFRSKALKAFKLIPTELIVNDQEHKVYNMDSNELIKHIEPDILYLDPPYNNRHYATNYHLLETISKYDSPKIYGKTGLREYTHQKSLYCYAEHAKTSLEELINKSKSKYIFISYSNEGIISSEDIKNMLESKGSYGVFEMQHSRYRTDSKRTYKAKYTIESLHYCIVNN
jgi:adenine-specific DNA-methyltransferase